MGGGERVTRRARRVALWSWDTVIRLHSSLVPRSLCPDLGHTVSSALQLLNSQHRSKENTERLEST